MPLGPGRADGRRHRRPVAKAAVVGAAIGPGPSPVAKAAVVGAAVGPGPSPVAKAAVVGAVVTPGPVGVGSSRSSALTPADPGSPVEPTHVADVEPADGQAIKTTIAGPVESTTTRGWAHPTD